MSFIKLLIINECFVNQRLYFLLGESLVVVPLGVIGTFGVCHLHTAKFRGFVRGFIFRWKLIS
jgi:hypothetical protein